jgi:gamma-glutamyltranspeptidase/glutathione hydrolase
MGWRNRKRWEAPLEKMKWSKRIHVTNRSSRQVGVWLALALLGANLVSVPSHAFADPAEPRSATLTPRAQSDDDRVYRHAAVAADHPLASQAGVEILKQGGNVVDAAVATGFALSVVRPASCGIGGGGFMVIWNAGRQKAVAIDYRERAPAASTPEMYFDPDDPKKARRDLSRVGHQAVAIPGHVAGLCHALREYGTLDLKTVLAPALRLCREGFPIDPHDREVQQEMLDEFRQHPDFPERFATLYRLYLHAGRPWDDDASFHSPLGPVLERIAASGADGFYRGPVADAIVAEMKKHGGLITADDLREMRPTVREPLTSEFEGLKLFTMPPPSSGGIALLQTLRLLQEVDQPDTEEARPPDTPARLHLLAEAFKHAFADRAEFLGDTDYAQVPILKLLGDEHIRDMARRIDPTQSRPSESYGRFVGKDDAGTSHFSVIDAAGNAVACTETINTAFGSLVVEPKFGIILNNEMDDFTAHPGVANAFGLKQSEANRVAPGKRPLSSMTPTILVRDGKAVFALGASGGPRIITATTQVLLRLARDGMSPREAVDAPRLHHQWLPDRLDVEREFGPDAATELKKFGHEVRRIDESAVVQAVSRSTDGIRAASDLRKHGRAAGF